MLKLLRKGTRNLKKAFFHSAFLYLSIIGTIVLFLTTAVVYLLEKGVNPRMQHYFDSLWWGVSTITTVGFGDIVPITTAGRIIGIGLMYTGTVLFITFTGVLVSIWTKEEVEKEIGPMEKEIHAEEKEHVRIERRLDEILAYLKRHEKNR